MTAVNWEEPGQRRLSVAANWSTNAVPTLLNAISISTSRAYIARSAASIWRIT